jgi:TorA maturation chaperone TorD
MRKASPRRRPLANPRAARASIYGSLADVFTSPPSAERVRSVRQMAEALRLDCPHEWVLSDLEDEYRALFVVPGPRYVAPYESVYRDAWQLPSQPCGGSRDGTTSRMIKGLVMGESTAAVRACYQQAGVAPSEELPDHIGNELRFMAYLWEREADAPGGDVRVLASLRARFRDQHLLQWVGELRSRVLESERLGYFPVALQIVETVLQDEQETPPRDDA